MTATLRVIVRAPTQLDAQLGELTWFRAARSDDGITVECLDEERGTAMVALARGGVATEDAAASAVPERSVPAAVRHLAPLAKRGIVDTVVARRVSCAEATAHLMRARRVWSGRRPDAECLRAVLRGADLMFAWRRIVWASRATLLSGALRGAYPIVFDRDAVERGSERYAFASANELTRWLCG